MKLRIFFNFLVVISVTLLVGVIAFDKMTKTEHLYLTNLFLQLMHVSFLVGSFVNLIYQFKKKQKWLLCFTLLPLVFFVIAFVGVFFNLRFAPLSLLLFDFYLIYWFFYLALREILLCKQ